MPPPQGIIEPGGPKSLAPYSVILTINPRSPQVKRHEKRPVPNPKEVGDIADPGYGHREDFRRH